MSEQATFVVGDWVTVLRWTDSASRSWCGACLRIEAISWPFLIVNDVQGGQVISGPIALDFQCVELVALGKEYVDAVNPQRTMVQP